MSEFPGCVKATVVSVKPGDVIVLKVEERISAARALDIKALAQAVWPDNQVLVTERIDVSVVRPEEDE